MADRHSVELSPAAARTLRGLERTAQKHILAALELLRDTPRPPTMRALTGHPGYLRIQTGDYRIVYTIDDGRLLVLVLAVGHRREIYRSS